VSRVLPPPDDAFVVRFGEMKDEHLERNAHEHYAYWSKQGLHEYALSVNVMPEMTAEDVAAFAQRPWGQFRYATFREIRDAGYEVYPSCEDDGHANLVLAERPPTPEDWVPLREVFAGSGRNPNRVHPRDRTIGRRPR
jgi:hypothetical protein